VARPVVRGRIVPAPRSDLPARITLTHDGGAVTGSELPLDVREYDESGDFLAHAAIDGDARLLRLEGSGIAPMSIGPVALVPDAVTELGDVHVGPGRTVRGRVVDASGAPVANAPVHGYGHVERGRRGAALARAVTATDGTFTLERLPEATDLWVGVTHGGFASRLAPVGSRGVEVVLRPGAALRAALVDPDGARVTTATVELRLLRATEGDSERTTWTLLFAEGGAERILQRGLPAGEYAARLVSVARRPADHVLATFTLAEGEVREATWTGP
jgi:hypothetical protein